MRDNNNYTKKQEKAKVFIKLGQLVGIEAIYTTQRGIIARRTLELLTDYKTSQSTHLDHLIKVNKGGFSFYIS